MSDSLNYQSGFNNHFASEAIANTLPKNQNNPQQVPMGLYCEQLSGDAFTVARKQNHRSWLYRLQPSVVHAEFQPYPQPFLQSPPITTIPQPPTQLRWQPLPYPTKPTDFIDGWITFAVHGNIAARTGAAIHLYAANQSMAQRFFYNADADLMIVPQEGSLLIYTEFGKLHVSPGEIAVIGRGIKFQVALSADKARGYVCENFGNPFDLPDLGLMGPNVLAQQRHFLTPTASFEQQTGQFTLLCKYLGQLWATSVNHHPLDVVAWHGNYVPYKYDLRLFTTINSVNWDHPDPSIFTVMTSSSAIAGVANLDFVIFPSRWLLMEHTMRLPYYHRNTMSEFMGLIYGDYDAKPGEFVAGGASLHNCMTAHGPSASAYQHAIQTELKPELYKDTLAFMFESYYTWQITEFAMNCEFRDKNYLACWQGFNVPNVS